MIDGKIFFSIKLQCTFMAFHLNGWRIFFEIYEHYCYSEELMINYSPNIEATVFIANTAIWYPARKRNTNLVSLCKYNLFDALPPVEAFDVRELSVNKSVQRTGSKTIGQHLWCTALNDTWCIKFCSFPPLTGNKARYLLVIRYMACRVSANACRHGLPTFTVFDLSSFIF